MENIMSLINSPMSSHCALDKEIFLCDVMKLSVFVGYLGNKINHIKVTQHA